MADDYEVIAITDEKTYRDEGPFTDDVTYYYRVRKVQDGVPGEYTNEVSVLYTNVESEKEGGSAAYIVISAQGGGYNETDLFNVLNYGVLGDGVTDDTSKINILLNNISNTGGGIAYFPSNDYLINSAGGYSGILVPNNTHLILDDEATLVEANSSATNTAVVRFRGVSNASITGGKIYGRRRLISSTSAHGLAIQGSKNITVKYIYISDCSGDGIYLPHNPNGLYYSENVLIDNVVSNYNRRQGLSIVGGLKATTIRNSIFSNTIGASGGPCDGVDIEPNAPEYTPYLDVVFDNCQFINNGFPNQPRYSVGSGGYGISIALGHSYWHTAPWHIVIKNCTGYGNVNGLTSAMCGYRNNVTVIDTIFNRQPVQNYENQIANPTFASGISGWTLTGATYNSQSNGVLTVTPTSNTVVLSQTLSKNVVAGKFYYFIMDVKASSSTLHSIKGSTNVSSFFGGADADGAELALGSRGTNYWFKIGGVAEALANSSNTVRITTRYTAYAGTLQFRNPRFIDLTAAWGENNIPSDAECYELYP